VNGKTGVLGDAIKVGRDKSKVTVTAETHMSKRWAVVGTSETGVAGPWFA
jgi:hypothetical protein